MRFATKAIASGVVGLAILAISALPARAQRARMNDYEDKVKDRIADRLEDFRLRRLKEERSEAAAAAARRRGPVSARATTEEDEVDLEVIERLEKPFESVVDLHDSQSGEGQDVEIRLTMPIAEFMEFAPVAALEAASIPHKFPVVFIFIREETTDRVARVAFKDAEPIAGRYLANDSGAIEEMKEALIWH